MAKPSPASAPVVSTGDADGNGRAIDGQEVVAAPVVERRRASGQQGGDAEFSDGRRHCDIGLREPVDRRARRDADEREAEGGARDRGGKQHLATAGGQVDLDGRRDVGFDPQTGANGSDAVVDEHGLDPVDGDGRADDGRDERSVVEERWTPPGRGVAVEGR